MEEHILLFFCQSSLSSIILPHRLLPVPFLASQASNPLRLKFARVLPALSVFFSDSGPLSPSRLSRRKRKRKNEQNQTGTNTNVSCTHHWLRPLRPDAAAMQRTPELVSAPNQSSCRATTLPGASPKMPLPRTCEFADRVDPELQQNPCPDSCQGLPMLD